MKRTLILVAIIFTSILALILTKSRKLLSSGYKYSVDYCKKNNANIKNFQDFVLVNDLLNDSIKSSFVQFFMRRKENVHIIRYSINGRFETTKPAPNYLEDFFLGNKLRTISIKKDGIIFKNIFYLWSSKTCSLKYFFNPHKLLKNSTYEEKYIVTDKETLNNKGETCCIIDENWVLLIENEK
jgi:hypothetical protein